MSTFLFTLGFFLLMAAAMAIGVIAGRKPIQGSCGGLSAATREDCPICGGNPARCDTPADGELFEDATRRR